MKFYHLFLLSLIITLPKSWLASSSIPGKFLSVVENGLKESNRNMYLERLDNNNDYHSRRFETTSRWLNIVQLIEVGRRKEEDEDDEDDEDEDEEEYCDETFLSCLLYPSCSNCFGELYTKEIDWASVSMFTKCSSVIDTIIEEDHCSYMAKDVEAQAAFCQTFAACAIWDNNDSFIQLLPGAKAKDDAKNAIEVHTKDENGVTTNVTKVVDCSNLISCSWEGYHESFIGDGICHDSLKGCYNSAICNYDRGDCCQNTCKSSPYGNCGSDGYACKDPYSPNCDSSIATKCIGEDLVQKEEEEKKEEKLDLPQCKDDEQIYRVFMYDSFGDGWDQTQMVVTPSDNHDDIKFNDTLKEGTEGIRYICLSKIPKCYFVQVSGGVWGNEVSWQVKPATPGAPALAAGGAPMKCTFSVAGSKKCGMTCSDHAKSHDPHYKSFKNMNVCIREKCVIQATACESLELCNPCFDDDISDYCWTVEPFLALVDCTICGCTESKGSDFCSTKKRAPVLKINAPIHSSSQKGGELASSSGPCSGQQSMDCLNAVRIFAECTNFDVVGMMISNFDENNFGDLDSFEACAHSFAKKPNHGGHTALGCMQILLNSMHGFHDFPKEDIDDEYNDIDDSDNDNDDVAPLEAIAALAKSLYTNAGNFCDCAREASHDCAICDSFVHFKTLLYESLDACQSLDEIDCDVWNEFATPCRTNLIHNYGLIDFNQQEQCDYLDAKCGGVGPFPAFRRLDCDGEIPGPVWDLYKDYASKCPDAMGNVTPQPTRSPPPLPPAYVAPVPSLMISSGSSRNAGNPLTASTKETKPYVPYVPPEERDSSYNTQYDTTAIEWQSVYTPPSPSSSLSSSHWIRNISIIAVLCGCGYYRYKKRSDEFKFVRYRRFPNYMPQGDDESEMYSSYMPQGDGESEMYSSHMHQGNGESEMHSSSVSMDSKSTSFEPLTPYNVT